MECKEILNNFEAFRETCLSNDKLFNDIYLRKGIEISENPVENKARANNKNFLEIGKADINVEYKKQILPNDTHKMTIEIVEYDVQADDEYGVLYLNTASDSNHVKADDIPKQSHFDQVTTDTISKKLCVVCNKFVNRLTQHQLIHNEIRPFQCEYCSKGFNQMGNLKKHIRMHTREKPYLCSWCDKGFTNSTELKVHIRSHTQEKPFKCKDCAKSFVTSGHLVRHARSHSGSKPYSCDVCQSKFSTSSHLVRHKRLHSMDYPYNCSACDARFMRTEYLKAHRCKLLKNHLVK